MDAPMPPRLTAPLASSLAATLAALLLLGAAAPALASAQEPAHPASAAAPRLDSRQALTRLLALIRSSERVEDFTPERLTEVFGAPFRVFEPGYWGFGEALSTRWFYSIERRSPRIGPRFSFGFNEAPGETPPIDDICGVDYAAFTAELEAMGFARSPYRGEHGRFLYDRFDRPGMSMQVLPLGEPSVPGREARICVKTVLIL